MLAAKVVGRERFAEISACCLSGEPGVEEAIGPVSEAPVYVVPNLMADGYAMAVLRERCEAVAKSLGFALHIAPPLGLCPGLPDVLSALALNACAERGWRAEASHLLLVGHGSQRSRRPAEVARQHLRAIAGQSLFASLSVGFLDEAPTIQEAISSITERPVVVLGLFADAGSHGIDDVPRLLGGADDQVSYAGPVGMTERFIELLNKEVDNLCRTAKS